MVQGKDLKFTENFIPLQEHFKSTSNIFNCIITPWLKVDKQNFCEIGGGYTVRYELCLLGKKKKKCLHSFNLI